MAEQHPFDRLARSLAEPQSRRSVLRLLGAGAVAAAAGTLAPRLGRTLADNPCATGLSLCGGSCKDLQSDPTNCGSCGNALPPGGQCINGQPAQSYSPQPPPGTITLHQTLPNSQVPQLFDPARTNPGAPVGGSSSGSSGNTANTASGTVACDDTHPCAAGCCSGGFCQLGTFDTVCGSPAPDGSGVCNDCTAVSAQGHCVGLANGGFCSNHCDDVHRCATGFCCDGNGSCVSGTSDTVCGSRSACDDCTKGQGHCVGNVCQNTCAQLGQDCNQNLLCCQSATSILGAQIGAQICKGPLGADGNCACNTAAGFTTCTSGPNGTTCCDPNQPCCADQCTIWTMCCGNRPCGFAGATCQPGAGDTPQARQASGTCVCADAQAPGGFKAPCYPPPGPNLLLSEVAFCCPPGQTCSADNTHCIGCEDTGGTSCLGANDKSCCPPGQDCCTFANGNASTSVCCPSGTHCSGGNGNNGNCACIADQQGHTLTACGFVNGVPGPNATCCPAGETCPDGQHCTCTASSCTSGCCNGSTCQSGTADTACGTSGTCQDCTLTGGHCVNGACSNACDATHPCSNSCCQNGTCLPAGQQSNHACGTSGACQDCTLSGGQCVDGQCTGGCTALGMCCQACPPGQCWNPFTNPSPGGINQGACIDENLCPFGAACCGGRCCDAEVGRAVCVNGVCQATANNVTCGCSVCDGVFTPVCCLNPLNNTVTCCGPGETCCPGTNALRSYSDCCLPGQQCVNGACQ